MIADAAEGTSGCYRPSRRFGDRGSSKPARTSSRASAQTRFLQPVDVLFVTAFGMLGFALGGALAIAGALLLAVLGAGALFFPTDRMSSRNRWRAMLYGAAALLALFSAIGRTPVPAASSFTPPAGRVMHPSRLQLVTTAYCRTGRTASGSWTRPGTIAATLPFGTRVRVPGYGTGRVQDRGGLVGPGHLDLYLPNCARAKTWGRRTLEVQIFPRA